MEKLQYFGFTLIFVTIFLLTTTWAIDPKKSRPKKQNWYEAQEKRLYDFLMRDHNTAVRPVVDQSNVTTIHIGAALLQILELNAEEEYMRTSIILRQEWQDDFLMWNPSDFENLNSIMLPKDEVWTPDFTFTNALNDGQSGENRVSVIITSDGKIKMNTPMTVKTHCAFDMEYYPRDTQACVLKLASYTLDTSQVEMQRMHIEQMGLTSTEGNMPMDPTSYRRSTEWDLLDTNQQHKYYYDNANKIHVEHMEWTIRVRRRASSDIWWMGIHTTFLALLPPFIFMLRHKEKPMAGLVLILIAAISVLFLEPKLPKSKLGHPAIARVAMGLFGITTIVTILAIITQRLSRIQRPPPRIIRTLLLGVCGRIVCVRPASDNEVAHTAVNMNSLDTDSNKGLTGDAASETAMMSSREGGGGDWERIACVLDRIFALLFSIIAACIIITVCSAISCNNDETPLHV